MVRSKQQMILGASLLAALCSACMTADDGMSYGARDHFDRQFRSGPFEEGSYDRAAQSYYVNGAWVSDTSAQGSNPCNRSPEADECVNGGRENGDREQKPKPKN